MGRAALAAALATLAVGAAGGCYTATSAPTVEDDVRLWQQAGQRRSKTKLPAVITFDVAVKLATENSAALRLADADVKVAQARVSEAGQPGNPELRVSNIDFDDLIDDDPNVELSLRFPIPVPGRLAARQDAARAGVHRKRAKRRAVESDVRVLVAELFVAMWAARERVALERRRLAILQRRAELAAKRVGGGVATAASTSRSELAVVLQQRKIQRLTSGRRSPYERLARLIGRADDAAMVVKLVDTSPAALNLPTREALVKLALERRHQRADAAWAVNAAKARVYAERSEGWPWFDFAQLGYRFQSPLKSAAFGLTVSFTLPLFHQNNGGVERARAELLRAELDRERWAVNIGQQIRAASERFLRARLEAQRTAAQLLPAAAKHVATVSKAVDANTEIPDALERARLRQLDAQAMVLAAQIEERYAHAALEKAIGGAVKR